MVRLFIIADDFTGALDTGVKLASLGASTRVVTVFPEDPAACEGDVLVWDAETRHMTPQQAYETVRAGAARLRGCGDCFIFKKTDSALRGNIGAELEGLLQGLGERRIAFLPAYPEIGRTTEGGVQYIDGVPVAESVFGQDLLNPVRHSHIGEIIGEQSGLAVHGADAAQPMLSCDGVTVFDACARQQMNEIFTALQRQGVRLFAGCAGAGACLPQLLRLQDEGYAQPVLQQPFFVLCGSINAVTEAQLAHAEAQGFSRLRLTPEQTLEEGWWERPEAEALLEQIRSRIGEKRSVIVDAMDQIPGQTVAAARALGLSVDDVRTRISQSLSGIFRRIFSAQGLGTMILIGGDTLQACMKAMDVSEMEPIAELAAGVVLARFRWGGCVRYVLTKSGGFGVPTLLTDLAAAAGPEVC